MLRNRRLRQSVGFYGGSTIFVSQDLNAIKMVCDKAILLHRGTTIEEGDLGTGREQL
jgi:ABC-type polysaccharide/polyol phosphate transport system ATPase subunit